MKWEEERAHESSRKHYGKRGISVHMILHYRNISKRVCLTTPESDATKDEKSTLDMTDVICKIITEKEKKSQFYQETLVNIQQYILCVYL